MEPMIIETLPKLFKRMALLHKEIPLQMFRVNGGDFQSLSYADAFQISLDFGSGLLALGISRGENIGLLSDNRKEWFLSDMGLLAIGCVDVPRGCDASLSDISHILSVTECKVSIVENATVVKKVLSENVIEKLPSLKILISFDKLDESLVEQIKSHNLELYTFDEIVENGRLFRKENPGTIENELEKGNPDDLATLIFTSGTTGVPKGVMLTHRNFFIQLDELRERIWLKPGEKALMILPVWHVYERSVEYVIFCQGATLCYSKPIGPVLMPDLLAINPSILPAVPRVYEALHDAINHSMKKTGGLTYTLYKFFVGIGIAHNKIQRRLLRKNPLFCYDWRILWGPFYLIAWLLLLPLKLLGNVLVFSKIKAKLGKNFRGGIAGGGAYPKALDNYFNGIGVKIVEGYGLTETAPIISVRPMDDPVFGTIGKPLRGIQAKIVSPKTGATVPCGVKGILYIKGDNVMQGYYKQPELTRTILGEDGWLNTGDLAVMTKNGELILKGRCKDTIVLRGGENVEPLPIEQAIMESSAIKTAVVVGQDQRALTCLIIPDVEELKLFAQSAEISYKDSKELFKNEQIYKMLQNEISSRISKKNGFKPYELINKFTVLEKDFEIGKELSSKQEISRFKINDIYKKEIAAMYK